MSIFPELLQAGGYRLVDLRAALLAFAPPALVRAYARPPALLALASFALVRADARPPALLASAPPAMVLAQAAPPALLACASDALVRTDTARLLLRGASCFVDLSALPSLAHAGCRRLYRRGALVAGSRGERGHQRECGSWSATRQTHTCVSKLLIPKV